MTTSSDLGPGVLSHILCRSFRFRGAIYKNGPRAIKNIVLEVEIGPELGIDVTYPLCSGIVWTEYATVAWSN